MKTRISVLIEIIRNRFLLPAGRNTYIFARRKKVAETNVNPFRVALKSKFVLCVFHYDAINEYDSVSRNFDENFLENAFEKSVNERERPSSKNVLNATSVCSIAFKIYEIITAGFSAINLVCR